MAQNISGKKIAILVADGFEESELLEPQKAFEEAGAETFILSSKDDEVKAWKDSDWGDSVDVDIPLAEANATDFDALLLPGGVMNPDSLRIDKDAIKFIKDFVDSGKPIAAICHGPWTLIEAGGVKGKKVTSWPSLKSDLENAGATWSDKEVEVDQGLVTSRKPDDIPAFVKKAIEEISEGVHSGR